MTNLQFTRSLGIQFRCASFGVFGRNGIGGLLRIWIVSVIRCLLLLVELFLIGLGLRDSRLVILSLLSLALFLFVINLLVGFLFLFFLYFLLLVSSGFPLYSLCIEQPFVYITFLLIKKKKNSLHVLKDITLVMCGLLREFCIYCF